MAHSGPTSALQSKLPTVIEKARSEADISRPLWQPGAVHRHCPATASSPTRACFVLYLFPGLAQPKAKQRNHNTTALSPTERDPSACSLARSPVAAPTPPVEPTLAPTGPSRPAPFAT